MRKKGVVVSVFANGAGKFAVFAKSFGVDYLKMQEKRAALGRKNKR